LPRLEITGTASSLRLPLRLGIGVRSLYLTIYRFAPGFDEIGSSIYDFTLV